MRLRKLYKTEPQVIGGKAYPKLVPSGKVKIIHLGNKQNFSTRFVEQGLSEGWLSIGDKRLTLRGEKGDVNFTIKRMPGRYAIKKEPGYEIIHFYECDRVK